MDRQKISPDRKDAFYQLLDDRSEAVRKALLSEFTRLGRAAADFLTEAMRSENRILSLHASWYLKQLKFTDPVEEFVKFIHSLNYELETGALLLNRTVMPDLDVGQCCQLLDEIAQRCVELMVPPMSLREKCRVINRVLFHEYGFRGNVEQYTDPKNSFLSEVLKNRRGLPITLSIIYLLVAQRCNLELAPISLPGHFLVGCYGEKPAFFIDPFARGTFRSPEDVLNQLRAKNTTPRLSYLTPTPVREVLCRCCRNLVNHYTISKDPENARLFSGFVHEFETTHQRNISS